MTQTHIGYLKKNEERPTNICWIKVNNNAVNEYISLLTKIGCTVVAQKERK